jgi:predicted CXXCH cytochrome family protein
VKKLLLASPGRELCLTCHKDPALDPQGTDWAVPHPALDDGCPTCHLPHVAEAPRLLAKAQRALCAGCHEDKSLNGDGVAWKVPHAPVATGMCASCHGAHGGPQKALLKKSVDALCGTCHTEVHARHQTVELDPATGQPTKVGIRLPPGFPVKKIDGRLGCVGCHQPHGSGNQNMWKTDIANFCTGCHQI